jgi:hypothetical protein
MNSHSSIDQFAESVTTDSVEPAANNEQEGAASSSVKVITDLLQRAGASVVVSTGLGEQARPDAVVLVELDDQDAQALTQAIRDAYEEQDLAAQSEVPDNSVDIQRLAEHFKVRPEPARAGRKINNGQAVRPKGPSALKPAAPKVAVARSERAKDYMRQAMQSAHRDEDGLDHLNTSSSAKTRLGQALDINAHTPFNHPDLGVFNSVGGLWYYIGGETQNDIFRTLHGQQCRTQGKKIRLREVTGFKTIIAEATWFKVMADSALRQAVAESTLPFRSYHLQGDLSLPVATVTEEWYAYVLETIRDTLVQNTGEALNTSPDFDQLDQPQRQRRDTRARR